MRYFTIQNRFSPSRCPEGLKGFDDLNSTRICHYNLYKVSAKQKKKFFMKIKCAGITQLKKYILQIFSKNKTY